MGSPNASSQKRTVVLLPPGAYHIVTRINEAAGDNLRMSLVGFFHKNNSLIVEARAVGDVFRTQFSLAGKSGLVKLRNLFSCRLRSNPTAS